MSCSHTACWYIDSVVSLNCVNLYWKQLCNILEYETRKAVQMSSRFKCISFQELENTLTYKYLDSCISAKWTPGVTPHNNRKIDWFTPLLKGPTAIAHSPSTSAASKYKSYQSGHTKRGLQQSRADRLKKCCEWTPPTSPSGCPFCHVPSSICSPFPRAQSRGPLSGRESCLYVSLSWSKKLCRDITLKRAEKQN